MSNKKNKIPARVLLVGTKFKLPDANWDEFYTHQHFLDYDIVVMDPDGALEGQSYRYSDRVHDHFLDLDERQGARFRGRYAQTTSRLVEFANKGGTAIIFLRHMPTLRYRNPDSRFRDPLVFELDDFLPWGETPVSKRHGNNIEFSKKKSSGKILAAIKSLWEIEGLWKYEAVFVEPPPGPVFAHVAGHSDEVVSTAIMTTGGGFVLLTPTAAIEPTERVGVEAGTKFIEAVRALHKAVKAKAPKADLPEWASGYQLPGEADLLGEISNARQQIEELQELIDKQTKALDDLSLHKLLFTAHDTPLEQAVDRVLTALGMKVEQGPKNRVDRKAKIGKSPSGKFMKEHNSG